MAPPFPPGQRSNIMPLLRVRVGLPFDDLSRDTDITAAFDTALALAESYTDRKFEAKTDTETFVHIFGSALSLMRYPIIDVDEVDTVPVVDINPVWFHVNKPAGLVLLDGSRGSHELVITYHGGYTDAPDADFPLLWPPDLLFALFQIFDKVWASGEAGADPDTPGNVKTLRAGDISITYGNDSADYGSFAAFGGMIPISATLILDLYTRRKA